MVRLLFSVHWTTEQVSIGIELPLLLIQVTIGRSKVKCYGVLFTRISIRAVHLGIDPSLTNDSAIMATRLARALKMDFGEVKCQELMLDIGHASNLV